MFGKMKLGAAITAFVLLIVLIALLSASIINVPAGNKAVVTSGFGVGDQLDEGWQLKNPFSGVENVRYNTQYQKETVSILTNDGYNVPMDIQIVYHLEENYVGDIRVDNPDYRDTVIMNQLRSQVRIIVSEWNYTGEDLNTKRALLATKSIHRIAPMLEQYHIIVESVDIRNVDLPFIILEATEQRQAAKVGVETAMYELEQAEFIAQKKVVTARAEYNVTVIEAGSQAEAQEILAEQSQNMDNTTMNFIMFLKWVNMLKDPECNVQIYITDEGVPVLMEIQGES